MMGIDPYRKEDGISSFLIMKGNQIIYNMVMCNFGLTKENRLRALLDSNKITLKEYLGWIKTD